MMVPMMVGKRVLMMVDEMAVKLVQKLEIWLDAMV